MEVYKYNWGSIVKTIWNLTLHMFVALGLKVSDSLSIKWEIFCSHSRVFKSMFSALLQLALVSRVSVTYLCCSFCVCKIIVINLSACLIPETLGKKRLRASIKMQILYLGCTISIIYPNSGNVSPYIESLLSLSTFYQVNDPKVEFHKRH